MPNPRLNTLLTELPPKGSGARHEKGKIAKRFNPNGVPSINDSTNTRIVSPREPRKNATFAGAKGDGWAGMD